MYTISDETLAYFQSRHANLHHQFMNAKPFPHLVIDGMFLQHKIKHLYEQFPEPHDGTWWKYENLLEKKLARNDLHRLPLALRELVHELMENRFVSFLEKVTGITGLIVDHTLNGGGLHQITRGGKLDIHADYNYHPANGLDRRLNLLLYLNPYWKPEWKGSLELWDKTMTSCVKSIEPFLNRMVIFQTTDDAFHGHPDPLECPEDESRKSLALYYYTNGRPENEKTKPHSTLFQKRPQDIDTTEHEELRRTRAFRRLGDQTT